MFQLVSMTIVQRSQGSQCAMVSNCFDVSPSVEKLALALQSFYPVIDSLSILGSGIQRWDAGSCRQKRGSRSMPNIIKCPWGSCTGITSSNLIRRHSRSHDKTGGRARGTWHRSSPFLSDLFTSIIMLTGRRLRCRDILRMSSSPTGNTRPC
jgi:hypothetical protein